MGKGLRRHIFVISSWLKRICVRFTCRTRVLAVAQCLAMEQLTYALLVGKIPVMGVNDNYRYSKPYQRSARVCGLRPNIKYHGEHIAAYRRQTTCSILKTQH